MMSCFQSRLSSLCTNEEMTHNFGDNKKIKTWRKLWVYLAKAEKELGLNITDEQIREMEANQDKIDFQDAPKEGFLTRHDVMAHVHVFASQCPKAAPIIHLGATSSYVEDNTNIILIKDGLNVLLPELARCIHRLSSFAEKYKDLPTLGFTDMQPAQLTTVGQRACLWISDLLCDLTNIERIRDNIFFRGVKGTGSQASFLTIFDGDHEKVKELNRLVIKMAGFEKACTVPGQMYSQKLDYDVISCLYTLSTSVNKIFTDIRLLASKNEIKDPFEKTRIGSRVIQSTGDPWRSGCDLEKLAKAFIYETFLTAFDVMECRIEDIDQRLFIIPGAFIAAEICFNSLQNVIDGLVVYPEVMNKNIQPELPFMATDNILIAMVKAAGDEQDCREEIRKLSQKAEEAVKLRGEENNFVELIRASQYFVPIHDKLDALLDPSTLVGWARQQVTEFLESEAYPSIAAYRV